LTHKNAPKNFQLPKTFLILSKKVGKIRKVLHFENEIEHKILVTYVIAKVSDYEKAGSLQARAKEIETLLLEKLERWEMLEGKQNGGGGF